MAKDPPGVWRCGRCGKGYGPEAEACPECLILNVKNVSDEVNHPGHYGGDTLYEVIKIEEALNLVNDHYLASVFEYISRWKRKGGIQDLEKARWWLDRRIQREKNGTDENGVTIIKEGS